jgi:TatD DNase family protein
VTDAHCHLGRGETRHFICNARAPFAPPDVAFYGTHPWFSATFDAAALRARLAADPAAGVGEIGLDRLKTRVISPEMRAAFDAQLAIAAAFARPVVLHGAKCWGEVVRACAPYAGRIPAFLFHGFSRSGGLLPDIVRLNGFVSVGPALLNDHAVNYRALVRALPLDRLLVESDATAETAADVPRVADVAAKLAEVRALPLDALVRTLESNAARFLR